MRVHRICPKCGATLDPEEKCDCEDVRKQQDNIFAQRVRVNPKTGQMAFRWCEEELNENKNVS